MPVSGSAIKNGLKAIAQSPPSTAAAAANQWGNAIQSGLAGLVPPSTTTAAAIATLKTALTSAFQTSNAAPTMETAFTAMGTTIGTGMLPAYTAVPPAGPVGFASIFSTNRSDYDSGAQAVADAIVAWIGTGSATLVAPPNTVIPWS